jgi:DNA-directed RNA polymerase subunit RPC12/RpoP
VIDWILTLLVIVLILVVFLLWRRTGVGPAPRLPGEGRPTTPPPPAAGPQPPQAAGPMSVTCRHCGKAIEITTSKRPIEVMCPSCGETQVVQ